MDFPVLRSSIAVKRATVLRFGARSNVYLWMAPEGEPAFVSFLNVIVSP